MELCKPITASPEGNATLLVKNDFDYHKLIEELDVAMYVCDTNGLITSYNKAAVSLWGREPELGKDLWCGSWKIFHTDGITDMPLEQCPMAKSLKEGRAIVGEEIIVERLDGLRRWVQPYPKPIFNSEGVVTGAFNMLIDITDRKESEILIKESEEKYRAMADVLQRNVQEKTYSLTEKNAELKKGEERYHQMIEEVQDYAILLLDKNGIILNWNKGAEKIKGYKESEIIGKSFKTFYLKKQLERNLPDKLLAEAERNGRAEHEGWRKRKDGSLFWGSVVITALHDEQNNVTGFSKVTRDLTERKQAEQRLKQYNRVLEFQNKELEQFAYIASHDLQEPLRKIQTFSQVIDDNIDDKEAVKKYLDKINNSANKMSGLIKAVLNYSTLSEPNTDFVEVEVNLNDLLKSVCDDFDLLISQKNAIISYSALPSVKGNVVQLRQLFSNLLSNSLKFSNATPVITVSSELPTAKEIGSYTQLNRETSYLKIIFKDNGIGFDQKYAEKIFNLFQRLDNNSSGTGIGLTICKKIIENHHGHLTATGEPNKGTTFNIYIPV